MEYSSFQHWILLSPLRISTTEGHFCFGIATSFILELLVVVLHSFPAAYWRPSNLGDSSFSVISFCPFIQFMGFSWLVYWSGLPFPPPIDHVLSELPAMTHLSLLRGKSEVMIYIWNLSSCRWDLKPKNRLNNLRVKINRWRKRLHIWESKKKRKMGKCGVKQSEEGASKRGKWAILFNATE